MQIEQIITEFDKKFPNRMEFLGDRSFVSEKLVVLEFIRQSLSTLISKQIEAIEGEKQDILDETPVDIWEKQVSYNEGINRAITILKTFK